MMNKIQQSFYEINQQKKEELQSMQPIQEWACAAWAKTEIFKRVVNRLFFEQDHQNPNAAIPVFFQFPDETMTRDSFALEYFLNC